MCSISEEICLEIIDTIHPNAVCISDAHSMEQKVLQYTSQMAMLHVYSVVSTIQVSKSDPYYHPLHTLSIHTTTTATTSTNTTGNTTAPGSTHPVLTLLQRIQHYCTQFPWQVKDHFRNLCEHHENSLPGTQLQPLLQSLPLYVDHLAWSTISPFCMKALHVFHSSRFHASDLEKIVQKSIDIATKKLQHHPHQLPPSYRAHQGGSSTSTSGSNSSSGASTACTTSATISSPATEIQVFQYTPEPEPCELDIHTPGTVPVKVHPPPSVEPGQAALHNCYANYGHHHNQPNTQSSTSSTNPQHTTTTSTIKTTYHNARSGQSITCNTQIEAHKISLTEDMQIHSGGNDLTIVTSNNANTNTNASNPAMIVSSPVSSKESRKRRSSVASEVRASSFDAGSSSGAHTDQLLTNDVTTLSNIFALGTPRQFSPKEQARRRDILAYLEQCEADDEYLKIMEKKRIAYMQRTFHIGHSTTSTASTSARREGGDIIDGTIPAETAMELHRHVNSDDNYQVHVQYTIQNPSKDSQDGNNSSNINSNSSNNNSSNGNSSSNNGSSRRRMSDSSGDGNTAVPLELTDTGLIDLNENTDPFSVHLPQIETGRIEAGVKVMYPNVSKVGPKRNPSRRTRMEIHNYNTQSNESDVKTIPGDEKLTLPQLSPKQQHRTAVGGRQQDKNAVSPTERTTNLSGDLSPLKKATGNGGEASMKEAVAMKASPVKPINTSQFSSSLVLPPSPPRRHQSGNCLKRHRGKPPARRQHSIDMLE